MKRVLLGGIKHETNSFVPGITDLDALRRCALFEGEDIFSPRRGSGQEIDGIIQVTREEGIDLVPTIAASGHPGPPVADVAYQYVKERILEAAWEYKDKLDGVMLSLHGAMTTESLEDPEGDLVSAVREVVGPDVPIVVSLDLHGHITDLMVNPSDAIIGFHTHPHVDFFDTGLRAMRILARALRGEVKPVVVQRKLKMITSAETHNTSSGPMSEIMRRVIEMEKEPGILAATVFATHSWMDVSQLGWSMVVVADRDRALAQARADELGMMAWERRERFLVCKTPIEEAVQRVLASDGKPFVLADSSDSVSGGANGDGNLLLRTLLATSYPDTAMITITDPEAVTACFAAGVGGWLTVPVGGKLTPGFYQPIPVTGIVKTLTDGKYVSALPPRPVDIGRTAVLQVGGMYLLLSEQKAGTIDAEAYRSAGLEPRSVKIVQVKSPGGFRAIYGPFAAGIFELAASGPTDSELPRLPFRKISRPLWPFDRDLEHPWAR